MSPFSSDLRTSLLHKAEKNQIWSKKTPPKPNPGQDLLAPAALSALAGDTTCKPGNPHMPVPAGLHARITAGPPKCSWVGEAAKSGYWILTDCWKQEKLFPNHLNKNTQIQSLTYRLAIPKFTVLADFCLGSPECYLGFLQSSRNSVPALWRKAPLVQEQAAVKEGILKTKTFRNIQAVMPWGSAE